MVKCYTVALAMLEILLLTVVPKGTGSLEHHHVSVKPRRGGVDHSRTAHVCAKLKIIVQCIN